jgi:hypothetical protein
MKHVYFHVVILSSTLEGDFPHNPPILKPRFCHALNQQYFERSNGAPFNLPSLTIFNERKTISTLSYKLKFHPAYASLASLLL